MQRLTRWASATAGLVLFAVSTRTTADPDLWGHLRFGLDTWLTHALPAVDPYSFTQDRAWINHEWLSELQMAMAYRAAGIAGLCLLKGALVTSALWLVWRALRGADFAARAATMGVVILGTGSITPTLRPQLWSLLAIAALCVLLARDDRRERLALPVLFATWANLHGGWVVGFGVLGAWAAADCLVTRRIGEWIVVLLASAAATLATPYGFTLWRFLWETVHVTRDITEWQPLLAMPPLNWIPVVATLAGAVWLLRGTSRHRLQIAAALAVLAFGAWRVSRIGPLFVVAAVIWLGPATARRWPQRPLVAPRVSIGVATVLLATGLVTSAWIASFSFGCVAVVGTWVAPEAAVRRLASAPAGRLVTFFDWGQYALWHLGPRIRVSMDGRRETVYSDTRLAEHDAILSGDAAGLAALAQWRAEYVWLPARSAATKAWLVSNGYRLDLDGPDAFLAVRADVPRWDSILESGTGRRCFPK
jgi:hypothetical protein